MKSTIHLLDLGTGVWISNHDDRFIVYVHESRITNGSFNLTWEWIAHPNKDEGLSKYHTMNHSYGVSTWPYHRPAMRIDEEETP